jgi:STE24 endopeptidase
MTSSIILTIILVILIADFVLEKSLDILNLKYAQKGLPKSLSGIYDEAEYNRSISYQRTNLKFGMISSTLNLILTLVVLSTGLFGWLNEWLNQFIGNPLMLSLVFFGVIFIGSDIINIPFSLYKTFVIEEKFGFNKTTPKLFVADKIKGILLTVVVGGIVLGTLLYLVLEIGQNFWIYFWVFISILMLLINMFYTSLIVPLFNKLTPLEDGELRNAIEVYSQKSGFTLDNIYVIDGSKRSTKANAYFSGIGKKKKIVLYDTLIANHTTEELVAVLAHEVGHFKKKHIISGLILSIFQIGAILFLLSWFIFNPEISKALGSNTWAVHLNLIAFGILFSPISQIIGILMNLVSRKNEFEADSFAAETYSAEPLMAALKKLSVKNLSNLNPHPAYVFMHYSHPPLSQRLDNLEKYILQQQA